MPDFDPKTFVNQMEAPCIGGPADGMRVPLRPNVRPYIEVEDSSLSAQDESRNWNTGRARKSVRYLAEHLRAGEADLVIYRLENASLEHVLSHLIAAYPRGGRS